MGKEGVPCRQKSCHAGAEERGQWRVGQLQVGRGSAPARGGWTRCRCGPRKQHDDAGSRQAGALGSDSPAQPGVSPTPIGTPMAV